MKTPLRKLVPAVAVAGVAALSLAACGGDKPAPKPKESKPASTSAPATTQAAEPSTPDALGGESSSSDPLGGESSSSAALGQESSSPAAQATGDAAVCKQVLDMMTKSGKEMQNSASDPDSALASIDRSAKELNTLSNKVDDAQTKSSIQKIKGYFTQISAAVKAKDASKLQELAASAQKSDSDLFKASMQLGQCSVGQ